MYKVVHFKPQNFGGYTFCMLISGGTLGFAITESWWWIIVSILVYFVGMYFFIEDNK